MLSLPVRLYWTERVKEELLKTSLLRLALVNRFWACKSVLPFFTLLWIKLLSKQWPYIWGHANAVVCLTEEGAYICISLCTYFAHDLLELWRQNLIRSYFCIFKFDLKMTCISFGCIFQICTTLCLINCVHNVAGLMYVHDCRYYHSVSLTTFKYKNPFCVHLKCISDAVACAIRGDKLIIDL